MRSLTRLARLATLLTTPLLLTGCASVFAAIAEDPKPLVTADPICKAAVKPICVSGADVLTRKSAADLVRNNEGILAACPKMRAEFEKLKCAGGKRPALEADPARPVKPPAQIDANADPKTS